MLEARRVRSIVGWTIVWLMTAMLVVVFTRAGIDKFSDTSGWARAFAHWGYPVWFRLLIGVLEVAAAALLLWPRTAPLGALVVIVVMLGAMGTHIVKDGGRHLTSEVMPLVFASTILFARRDAMMRLVRHHRGSRVEG
jgi:putative oxidoreductase